MFVMINRKQ